MATVCGRDHAIETQMTGGYCRLKTVSRTETSSATSWTGTICYPLQYYRVARPLQVALSRASRKKRVVRNAGG